MRWEERRAARRQGAAWGRWRKRGLREGNTAASEEKEDKTEVTRNLHHFPKDHYSHHEDVPSFGKILK